MTLSTWRQFFPHTWITTPVGIGLSINGENPFVPGQPISVTWSLTNQTTQPLNLGSVTVSLELTSETTNNPLFSTPLWTMSASAGILAPGAMASGETTIVPSAVADPRQLSALYSVQSPNSVRVTFQGSGANGGPYVVDYGGLGASGEPVDSSWVAWSSPSAGTTITWKAMYEIVASFLNKSEYAIMTPQQLQLLEINSSTSARRTIPLVAASIPASPDAASPNSESVSSGELVQDFEWFEWDTYATNRGFPSEAFSYQLQFQMQDQYGNQYPAVSSGFLPIVVAIPADKKQHLDNAVQALGAAGTLTVVGAVFGIIASTGVAGKWGSIGLGALASLCGVSAFATQQYASGEANQAADPPTPDYATRETVLVRGFLLAGRFPTDPELAPIGTMLQLFDLIGATQVALGQVSCKILGAKKIGDTVGLSQQQAAYQSLLAGLVDAANQLPKATANAVAVFASIFSTLADQLAKGLTQLIAGGLDSNTRELLLKSSVPGNLIQALDDALAAKALLDPTVLLGPQLTSAAAGLSSSVSLLAKSSAQLLA